jgi:hypothetical protein
MVTASKPWANRVAKLTAFMMYSKALVDLGVVEIAAWADRQQTQCLTPG